MHYSIRCGGVLDFKANRILESSCADGFFPSGCYWEKIDNRLTLRDSGGKVFADFEIKTLNEVKLLLVRKEIEYVFQRINP